MSYGMLYVFDSPEDVLKAAVLLDKQGAKNFDVYSPFPIEGLSDVRAFKSDRVNLWALIGGLCGGLGAYFMQYYSATVSYPINVGGRPYNSWPAFIPVTFALTILGGALFALVGMLVSNHLPCYYHPVFNSKHFNLAAGDRFYLMVRSRERLYQDILQDLKELRPLAFEEVAP